MPVSLVTPSTSAAISSPNSARTSSSEALVSSTVSCSSAAHSVSVSSRMPAQILATPTGWMMKSSPRAAALVRVVLAGEHERALHRIAVDLLGRVGGVLLDHRHQVAEQAALEVREVGRRARRGVRRGAVDGLVVEVDLAVAALRRARPHRAAPWRAGGAGLRPSPSLVGVALAALSVLRLLAGVLEVSAISPSLDPGLHRGDRPDGSNGAAAGGPPVGPRCARRAAVRPPAAAVEPRAARARFL